MFGDCRGVRFRCGVDVDGFRCGAMRWCVQELLVHLPGSSALVGVADVLRASNQSLGFPHANLHVFGHLQVFKVVVGAVDPGWAQSFLKLDGLGLDFIVNGKYQIDLLVFVTHATLLCCCRVCCQGGV